MQKMQKTATNYRRKRKNKLAKMQKMEKTATNFRRKSKKFDQFNNINNNNLNKISIMTESNDLMSKTQYDDKGIRRGFSFKKGNGSKKRVNDLYNMNNFNNNFNPILNTETNAYANVIENKNLFRKNNKRNNSIKNSDIKKLLPNIKK